MTTSVAVINMDIPPKTIKQKYRKHELVVTFQPAYDDKPAKWLWTVKQVIENEFSGDASAIDKAIKAAKRKIDEIVDGF